MSPQTDHGPEEPVPAADGTAHPGGSRSDDRTPRVVLGITTRWWGALALGLATAAIALATLLWPTQDGTDARLACGSALAPRTEFAPDPDGASEVPPPSDEPQPEADRARARFEPEHVANCAARRQQQQGWALLTVLVGGAVTTCRIARAATRDVLDARASAASPGDRARPVG